MADLFENPIGTDGFEFVEFAAPARRGRPLLSGAVLALQRDFFDYARQQPAGQWQPHLGLQLTLGTQPDAVGLDVQAPAPFHFPVHEVQQLARVGLEAQQQVRARNAVDVFREVRGRLELEGLQMTLTGAADRIEIGASGREFLGQRSAFQKTERRAGAQFNVHGGYQAAA